MINIVVDSGLKTKIYDKLSTIHIEVGRQVRENKIIGVRGGGFGGKIYFPTYSMSDDFLFLRKC